MLKTLRKFFLAGTHLAMLALGFALGVYMLPILTAPKGPDTAQLASAAQAATFKATFRRDLKGSDFFHWGDGTVNLTPQRIAHDGKLAPGPDYKLYLVKLFCILEEGLIAILSDILQDFINTRNDIL